MLGSVPAPWWCGYAILGLVAGQRIAELLIANRNTRALMLRGAVEVGATHYPFIVALHAAWLVSLVGWVSMSAVQINLALLAVFVGLQLARLWILRTLGRFWTTRIITLPGAPLIRSGPYRFLRHPNYLVVVLEIAVLPLVLGAWPIAVAFSILNACLLVVRIRAEELALAQRS